MKISDSIKNILSEIKKEKIKRFSTQINSYNCSSLCHLCLMGTILSLLLSVLSLPFIGVLHMMSSYAVMCLLFVSIFILTQTVLKKHLSLVRLFYYLLMILILIQTIYMGTVAGKNTNATTFLLVLLLFPLFIVDYPWRLITVNGVMTISFIITAILTKPAGTILSIDISNAIVSFFLSVVFIIRTNQQRILNFENVQKEKDELEEKNILINAIPAGIAIYEIYGDQVKQVYTNDSFYRLFEDTREERTKRNEGNFLNSIYPDDRPRLAEVIKNVIDGNDYLITSCRSIKGDGSYLWVRFAASVDKRSGSYIRVYTTYTSMEEEMKSRYVIQAKTDFLSRMSHDILTPLNAIMGTVALAKNEKGSSPAVREYLNTIDSSGHFLLRLINDVLDINIIESGKIELRPEYYPVSEYIDSINAHIRPMMEKKHIDFSMSLNCGQKAFYIDKVRHYQIFFNLLSNAAKYTPEYGKVEYITMSLDAPDGMVGIRNIVRDNGIGMTEEYVKHLYTPFSRDTNAIINQTEGSGLGLAVVKNIVDAMGGTIQVKSESGKGTEFIVDLFIPSPEKYKIDQKKKISEDSSSLSGKKILLVEDNKINTRITARLLINKGCIVDTVVNGYEAVEYMKQTPENSVDLILMDIRMPVMDGIEATKEIRTLSRTDVRKIPIVAMTADCFAQDPDRMIELSMNGYIPKPVNPDLFYSTLSDLLSCKKN